MSTEDNKTIIRRVFEDGLNQRQLEVYDDLIAADYVNHNMPTPAPGPEGFKQVVAMFVAAFPDVQVTIEEVIAEGNTVATRGVMRGTHRNPFMGIPPTGKRVSVSYIDLWHMENGKAVENWVQMDMLGMMQQLGVVPEQAQS